MKKLLFGLLTLASLSSFAQTKQFKDYTAASIFATNDLFAIQPGGTGNYYKVTYQVLTNLIIGSLATPIGNASFINRMTTYLTNVAISNMPSGTNDLITVPIGYKLLPLACIISTTNAGNAWGWYRTNGVTYQANVAAVGVVTIANINFNFGGSSFAPLILEAGETYTLSNTVTGFNVFACFRVIPNTVTVKTVRTILSGAGDNTVYTVPTGKHAHAVTENLVGIPDVNSKTALGGNYVNYSGGARTVKIYYVPSGGSVGTGTILTSSSYSNLFNQAFNVPPMNAGDSIVINTDAGTAIQMFMMTVFEASY